jgi:threonylcarbamoyladenosine tRNA methylthiotransferase MtaB
LAILYNVGCKLNQYEGLSLAEKYKSDSIVVINTCCVTHEAEVKSLKKLHQAQKKHPDKKIIVTGCLVKLKPELFNGFEIIGLDERNDIIKEILPAPQKSRYFLKIEDGCNQPCTFCVVSKLRTTIISKPVEKIKLEIDWAKGLGFNEVVLVGANIGLYGLDIGSSLVSLLNQISKIPDLPRIRLSSLEPNFINMELISILKDLPFCRHFHIPIQSGDDKILSLMGRRYTSRELEDILELIIKNFSDVAIGADVIVGFPGEEEKAFKNTLELIKNSPLTHLHIFTYSPRPITPAWKFGDAVSVDEKKRRFRALKEIIIEKNFGFRLSLVNKIIRVIIEKKDKKTMGLTDNYIRINIDQDCKERELRKARIIRVTKNETFGTIV